MADLIKAENADRLLYERLLLERDALRKEAAGYTVRYVQEFGELMLALYHKKVDCISKKKSIAFCQQAANHGQPIDARALQNHLEAVMAEYQSQLKQMALELDACRGAQVITERTALRVKSLYRKIAKQIHPDMNPKTAQDATLSELWERVADAYQRNDLDELQDLAILVQRALQNVGENQPELVIPHLKQKTERLRAEIEKIKSTDPYQYKYLLEDRAAIEEKRQSLQNEMKEYTAYERELATILQGFLANGVIVSWPEN